jgi:anti-sigma regulatory factor (Ser/Thr protein kinase)
LRVLDWWKTQSVEGEIELSQELPAVAASVGRARALVEEIAPEELDDHDLWPARLLLSEVVTNAVRHGARGPGSTFGVRLVRRATTLRVEVSDGGSGFVPSPRVAGDALGSGWGLHFVADIAQCWGVEVDDRTLVWFEVALDGTRSPLAGGEP